MLSHHAKTDLPIVSLSNKTHAHAGKIDAEDVKGRWRAWYFFCPGASYMLILPCVSAHCYLLSSK